MSARDTLREKVDDVSQRWQFVATHLVQVMGRLADASGGDDGYPSGSGGAGGGGGGAPSSTVERAALRRATRRGADPATADLRRLQAQLERASLDVFRLEQQVLRYVTVPREPDRRCTTCARLVPGATRRGLCAGCYQAWLRAGKPGEVSA